MVKTKRIDVQKILIFTFLVLFPFGQLLRTEMFWGVFHFVLQPIDIIVGLSSFFFVLRGLVKRTLPGGQAKGFMAVLIYSFFFSLAVFKGQAPWEGLFYLGRLIAYLIFPLAIKESLVGDMRLKETYFTALIAVSVFIGIFGWWQYLIYPDVRWLYYLGWDDHLYRIVGTFLDPGFISLLLVLGINLSSVKILEKFKVSRLLIIIFLLSALLFTYSRAGYLALLGSAAYLLWIKGKKKLLLSVVIIFLALVFLLPRPAGEGVKLERLYSVFLRLNNYQETLDIWKKWPLFGVGYNNMCMARVTYYGNKDALSHACSGSDSSLLLLLATTGLVGFLIFLKTIRSILSNLKKDFYGTSFAVCAVGVLIHSLFVNSLFYPWVMGYLGILFGLSGTTSNNEG